MPFFKKTACKLQNFSGGGGKTLVYRKIRQKQQPFITIVHIPMNIPPSFSVFHLPIFRAIHLFFPTMFLDFNPIFVETAQFLSAKRKIVWLRTILRCAANELRTYRTPPKRHSDVIICPKKDPSPLLYLSSKKAFTRSYFLYTNALR